jgi:hydroxymethylpyrimidine/phosphomethylpyrimidine kinase
MRIASCKIGVIPNEAVAFTIADILTQLPSVPVVFDPVINASSGSIFSDAATIETIKEILLPAVTIVTPNFSELDTLINNDGDYPAKAQSLCSLGPKYVLTTGADNQTDNVHNTLFTCDGVYAEYDWPRLPHIYHGSGCTLSSALACYLAFNLDIFEAVEKAQKYTWQSLQNAQPVGSGQWIPTRINTAID